MLRTNAVDERYLTSYTAYRTSGGLAPGGGLRHAASGSEMCFCIHPRSASAHVRTPPTHNTQHTTHPTKPNQHTVDNKTPTTKNTTTTQTTKTKPKHNQQKKPAASPTGNRTPVTRVTGGYTDHYTIEEEAMSEHASQTE